MEPLLKISSDSYYLIPEQGCAMSMPSEVEMRNAIAAKDQSFDGQFFYGVITTGVFCLPSCSSKSANPDNLRFFSSIETAMVSGFRPCKRCHPVGKNSRIEKLIEIAHYIEEHSDEPMTLSSLGIIAGLSPSRLQKTFKEVFGISPKSYQDAARMLRFKQSLKDGDGVTDAIYASGFGSISRVYGDTSRTSRSIGMPPKTYRAGGTGEHIYYACRSTGLGLIMMAATDKGVCFVEFGDDSNTLIAQLKNEFPKAKLIHSPAENTPELDIWIEALDKHISQRAPRPDLPLDMRGTAFQILVWQFLLSIKEGDILSYSEVAEHINKPKALRAVASACGKNRIGVLIPCHRVLRSDGGLGGYRWGLKRKRALLDAERKK